MRFWVPSFLVLLFLGGCAAPLARPLASGQPVETSSQQAAAAQKVLGGMAGREVSREDLRRVAADVRANAESRSAVEEIIGAGGAPVIKYSPSTGKHYSADLEFDPDTGEKLKVLAE
ncbi:MAG: hypothetical protein HQL20_04790 [Candidatus Omnitrophica bacterium]|nr:hypothetical protein [Candidatus Omnitrophota bacterium]